MIERMTNQKTSPTAMVGVTEKTALNQKFSMLISVFAPRRLLLS